MDQDSLQETKNMATQFVEGGKIATETIGLFDGNNARITVLILIGAGVVIVAAVAGLVWIIKYLAKRNEAITDKYTGHLEEDVKSSREEHKNIMRDIINRKT